MSNSERRLRMYKIVRKISDYGHSIVDNMDAMMDEDIRMSSVETNYNKMEALLNDLWKECTDEYRVTRADGEKWSKEAEQFWSTMESS